MSADSLIVLTNTIRKNAHRKGIFFALSIERAVSSHSQRRKIRIVLTKNKKATSQKQKMLDGWSLRVVPPLRIELRSNL